MKKIFILLFACMTCAHNLPVESRVYRWNDAKAQKQGLCEVRHMLQGATRDLDMLKVDAVTIPAAAAWDMESAQDCAETLIITKQGELNVRLKGEQKQLPEQSVVMVMPGDTIRLKNNTAAPATFYSLTFNSRRPADLNRAAKAGGSFMIDHDSLEFKPHDKGGRYDCYRRPTAMFDYAEMHVTRLNAGVKSHEPHTHGAAEIVLMISGNTKMQIGDNFYTAGAGDFYYLEAEVSHAIQNIGDESCMYFAFQWE